MKHRMVFSILMSLILSILMTCWVTWINLGWGPEFIEKWMVAFRLAWPAAALIAFILGPFIQTTTQRIVSKIS
ncbi:DUF2798 domain-containing protein [Kiloniella sp.]|uniref:DUF2798 domain-containing protein n=1 Tax=Kiloniella sp. TaxID=1938587 RepID=UPI003B02B61D